MRHNILYIAKYSLIRMMFIFLISYPLPMYLLIGSSIDLFASAEYLKSASLIFLTAPLAYIFWETIFTKEIIFYDKSVSKIRYFTGEVNIPYYNGYIVCPTGLSKLLSSAYHIRNFRYSFVHRIIVIMIFFSKETRVRVEDIIHFLTDHSHGSVRKFTKTKLFIG